MVHHVLAEINTTEVQDQYKKTSHGLSLPTTMFRFAWEVCYSVIAKSALRYTLQSFAHDRMCSVLIQLKNLRSDSALVI